MMKKQVYFSDEIKKNGNLKTFCIRTELTFSDEERFPGPRAKIIEKLTALKPCRAQRFADRFGGCWEKWRRALARDLHGNKGNNSKNKKKTQQGNKRDGENDHQHRYHCISFGLPFLCN